ncbi:hypothetical protein G9F73_004190 [Clostridium estertheticum]|uniref:hypothetical protein n=1 Tax=Clostridium estertheticum TaxID=238834 RepID=UPI0013EE5569|nr:hypothetical protein [Clostridium estertheticum]MBZ9607032.1 hypothetical protein [Clostridium estertheticum]
MDKILIFIKDIIKSIILGLIISLILILISILGAILVIHGGTKVTLEIVRSTLFIVGGLGLIVYSGFILKRNARRSLRNDKQWKERFQVINFVNVLLIVNIMILISGIVIDDIRYYL